MLVLSMLAHLALLACSQQPDYSALIKATELYKRASSVSGTIECEGWSGKETWTFSIVPRRLQLLNTPWRVYLSQPGRYVIYHPFNRTYGESFAKGSLVQLNELWLFAEAGATDSAPFARTKTPPYRMDVNGRPAWAVVVDRPDDHTAECYFDFATGAILGWKETSTKSGVSRRFQVKALRWNSEANSGASAFMLPPNAKKVTSDDVLFLPPGQPLPDARLVDEKGRKARLVELLKGTKGAVVAVGSPGCGPCEAAKRFASKNMAAFRARNVRFIALEAWGCTESDLLKIVKANPVPFPTYRADGADDLNRRLSLAGAPTLYIVDGKGRVLDGQQGFEVRSYAKKLRLLGLSNLRP